MVDIQSATGEIRPVIKNRKKKDRNHKAKISLIVFHHSGSIHVT